MTPTDKVLSRVEGGVATIVFNNPERHNAVSLDMWETTARMLDTFATDEAIRVIIFTGAGGKAFVSGADISKFQSERATQEAVDRYNVAVDKLYTGIHRFPKPTIAMIRGYCIGGGLGLAVSCDIRICTENSRFALPAAKLSLGYSLNGIKRFVDVVGPAFTKEIFFTARQFSSAEAREMGLVNRVVGEEELEDYVRNYADTIAANAPLTVKATKYTVGQALEDGGERDYAGVAQLIQDCFASTDYEEGRRAFMEKRKPVFTGR
jgi:enoyl-CoA hydratase/carnithine racemase